MDTLALVLDKISGMSFALAGALALAAVVYLAAEMFSRFIGRRKASGSLQDFLSVESGDNAVEFGSARHKIRLTFAAYGVNVAGREEGAFYAAVAAVALIAVFAVSLLQVSPLLALAVGAAAGYLVVRSAVDSRWEVFRQELESEIPTFMRNISGAIQSTPNVVEALAEAGKSLDPHKPLHAWLEQFIAALQMHGRGVLQTERDRAHEISSTLGILVYQIERLWDSGGQGYARAFKMSADNLGEILLVKGQAHAKTGNAMTTAKFIIASAVVTLGYIISSPSGQRIYMGNSVVKIAMLLAVLWGVYGWGFIKTIVREAVE